MGNRDDHVPRRMLEGMVVAIHSIKLPTVSFQHSNKLPAVPFHGACLERKSNDVVYLYTQQVEFKQ
jgi:hypothetical protein